jgi:hypothetical protein
MTRGVRLLVVVLAVWVWSPDPAAAQGCTYDVTGTLTSVGAEQANALVTVTTQAGCAWTAAGNGAWLNPATPSGTGSATVTFGVLANPGASLREGTVTLAGVPVTITQAGASCTYSVTGTWTSVGPEQANAVVSVTTATGCPWTAVGNGSWLNPATPSGSGAAAVTFGVLANTSATARTGTVTLAGVGVTITQAAGCGYQVTGLLTSVGPQQANAQVGVTTQAGCAWTVSSGAAWLTPGVASGSGSATVTVGVLPQPGSAARTGLVTIAGVAVSITQTGRVFGDVDGDGTADVSIWRPGDGTWQTLTTASSYQTSVTTAWGSGASGDQPVPGDYDGDGRLDAAVWRGTTGVWSIRLAASGQPITVTWGSAGAGDVPVPADYDGDGKTDIAVWRAPEGIWYLLKSSALYQQSQAIPWGQASAGDRPVPADFDGDGKADPAVWRPTGGQWQMLTSSSTYTAQLSASWGQAGDAPVPADYDGDGKADPAVWRGTTTEGWFRLDSSDNYHTWHQHTLGRTDLGHRATPLDVDGDARADLAVWGALDGPDGGWWIRRSSQGYAATQHFQFGSGAQSDRPVSLAPPALGTSGPPGVCTYDVTPLTRAVGAGSEAFSFTITTQAGCAWEAETAEGPITISSAASGVGSGTVSYDITTNPLSSPRNESLTIAGHVALVTQAGIGGTPCTYEVMSPTAVVGYQNGSITLTIETQAGCSWTTDPTGGFLYLMSAASGTGPASVIYGVQNNTAPEPRTTSVDVAGRTTSLAQRAFGDEESEVVCDLSVSVAATGADAGQLHIAAPPWCRWNIGPEESWVTVGTTSGSGNGSVGFVVDRSTMPAPTSGDVSSVAPLAFSIPFLGCAIIPIPCIDSNRCTPTNWCFNPSPNPGPPASNPVVVISEASAETDRLVIRLSGSIFVHTLTVELLGGPSGVTTLFTETTKPAGEYTYTLSEKLQSANPPAGTYTGIRARWAGVSGQRQVSIVRCGDARDAIIAEYRARPAIGLIPTCDDFSQSRSSAYFSFPQLNTGDHNWALIRQPLIVGAWTGYGLDKWRENYGQQRNINSAYRNPERNFSVPGAAQASRHMFGDAVDMDVATNTLVEWLEIADALEDALPSFIEPQDGPCKLGCVHGDWRYVDGGYR